MQVMDVMRRHIITATAETPMVEAAGLMRDAGVGCIVVVNSGSIAGIITDRDIAVRCIAEGHDPRECRISHHMTADVITAHVYTDLLEAAHVMNEKWVKRLPVTEGGRLVGLLSFSDIAQALDRPMHDLLIGMGAARRVA